MKANAFKGILLAAAIIVVYSAVFAALWFLIGFITVSCYARRFFCGLA